MTRMRAAAFLLLLALPLLSWNSGCAPPLHATAIPPLPIGREVYHYKSDGHTIRVDVYRPDRAGDLPGAIVVHGSSGVHTRIRNTATRYAKSLAEQGIVAAVVHYFDATHTIKASAGSERRNFATWTRVLQDAVPWFRALPGVDPNEIGMLGHSLGAFLAVGVASADTTVRRVVLFGGALDPSLEGKVERMPPTLMCHGDADDSVPLENARHLVDYLQARRCEVQLVVYPGEKHTFSDPAICDALTRAARFLSPALRGEGAEGRGR